MTQGISLLITPAIFFGFAEAMRRANNNKIDPYILIGLIITGSTPTTISSNIVMTRQSNGNDSLALIEVTIGNILGAFVTPALVQLFTGSSTGFAYGNPAQGSSVTALYGRVLKQLSLAVFLPLLVGQVVQNIWPKQVKYAFAKFYIAKLGSVGLLILIWATFSTAFHQNAFEEVPPESIIMVVFFNIGIYLLFCGISFALCRIPTTLTATKWLDKNPDPPSFKTPRLFYKYWLCRFVGPFYCSRKDTVAVILCGAAKTVVLGVPLINAQFSKQSDLIGRVSVPLVLYQGEQLVVTQLLIPLFKRWIAQEEANAVIDVENQSGPLHDDSKATENTEPTRIQSLQ